MVSMPSDELLRPLNDVEQKYAPRILFAEGDQGVIDAGPRVSVIGSRAASAAGLQNAGAIAKGLVEHSVVVVSGLTEGIDTAAHQAAIAAGGRTIALISDATIIVEAGSRSGTEHQGWEALRLGRPLFILGAVAKGHGAAWVAKLVDYGAMVMRIEDLWLVADFLPSAVGLTGRGAAA